MQTPQAVLERLQTVRDMIRYGMSLFQRAGLFYGHGTASALDEATQLVLHVLHLPADLPGHFMDARLLEDEINAINALFQQRIDTRKPAAYLTGKSWFAGLEFKVDERVLVPRSPIAELIENHFEPWIAADQVQFILDMCTGSGCIAIACAHYFPYAQVDAVDISPEALEVAQANRAHYQLEDDVRLVQSDLFTALQGERYDIIVSNPPYVDAAEMAALPAEFHHEPALGLASGADGLDATRQILREAADHLTEHGILVVEVGASAPALEAAYPNVPFTWLDFQRGGDGVFLLSRDQLVEHSDSFA